jgi:quercetin dioxygenase-like cupin family protein
MEISRVADGTYEHGDEGRFTGEVSLRGTLRSVDGTNVGLVHFASGARTHWHHHEGGQFLYAVVGRGRVRSRGEAGHILEPGDVVSVQPNEWHFHGGAPDSPLVHIAVNGGGDAVWGDPVTDEEYDESF